MQVFMLPSGGIQNVQLSILGHVNQCRNGLGRKETSIPFDWTSCFPLLVFSSSLFPTCPALPPYHSTPNDVRRRDTNNRRHLHLPLAQSIIVSKTTWPTLLYQTIETPVSPPSRVNYSTATLALLALLHLLNLNSLCGVDLA